jgi:putative glutamine amidotransferase
MGGTDFEPVTYGAERHTATDAKESPRDALELYVIRKALADKKPFLGICRGCQALAIAGGGTLHQHLAEIAPDEKHDAGKDGIYDDLAAQEGHKVFIAPGTKAHTLLKKDAIITNSGHHQGIRTVGDNFVISGTTKGGVVEIIEHAAKDFFCFGIQAHPEAQEEGDCEPFFKAFAEACEKT